MFYLFKHLNLLQQKINKTKEPKRSITTCDLGVALHLVLKIKKNTIRVNFGYILWFFGFVYHLL